MCIRDRTLGKKPRLHLFRKLQFLCRAAFHFQFPGNQSALRFDVPIHRVEAHQRKGVSVHILEPGEDSAPNGRLLRGRSLLLALVLDASQAGSEEKTNAAPPPFFPFGNHILGNENNPCRPAYELVLLGFATRRDQCEDCRPIRWSDRHPSVSGLQPGVKGHPESELVHIESQASLLIANKNVDGVNSDEGGLPVCVSARSVCPARRREVVHWSDYKSCRYLLRTAAPCARNKPETSDISTFALIDSRDSP